MKVCLSGKLVYWDLHNIRLTYYTAHGSGPELNFRCVFELLFEYPPCSDLFHIGHCIIPRSQGCVWLVG